MPFEEPHTPIESYLAFEAVDSHQEPQNRDDPSELSSDTSHLRETEISSDRRGLWPEEEFQYLCRPPNVQLEAELIGHLSTRSDQEQVTSEPENRTLLKAAEHGVYPRSTADPSFQRSVPHGQAVSTYSADSADEPSDATYVAGASESDETGSDLDPRLKDISSRTSVSRKIPIASPETPQDAKDRRASILEKVMIVREQRAEINATLVRERLVIRVSANLYKCRLCPGSRFRFASQAKIHCTRHLSPAYECPLCSRRYKYSSTILRHLETCPGSAQPMEVKEPPSSGENQ